MPPLLLSIRILLAIIAAVAGILAGLLGQAIWPNVVYKITRRGRVPNPRPLRLWVAFCLSVIVTVIFSAAATFAPSPDVLPPPDVVVPNITSREAFDLIDEAYSDELKNYDLVDVVGSYYICLQKPSTIFHRFPEWLFVFRDRNTQELLVVKVSDSRLPDIPDVGDLSNVMEDGWIAYYNVIMEPQQKHKLNIVDERGRVRWSYDGKGPEDNIREAIVGVNSLVLARVQVYGGAVDTVNTRIQVEGTSRMGKILIRKTNAEGNRFYNELMPIKGWKLDIEAAVQTAKKKGAEGLDTDTEQISGPGVVRLYNGKWENLNGTYLTGAFWALPYKIGIRPILVDANSGQLYAVNDEGNFSTKW